MTILIDSSVWIEYFRGTPAAVNRVNALIDENRAAVCDVVLAELVPVLLHRKEHRLVSLLKKVERRPLSIDWNSIVAMQAACLKHGINKVGIPDLLIIQHAVQHGYSLCALDTHFHLMAQHLPFSLLEF